MQVQEGVDELLFSLLILGQLTAHSGHVWLRSKLDFYVVEVLPLMKSTRGEKVPIIFVILYYFSPHYIDNK